MCYRYEAILVYHMVYICFALVHRTESQQLLTNEPTQKLCKSNIQTFVTEANSARLHEVNGHSNLKLIPY